MRKLVFSFLVVFSSIVFGQSGFNPPKTKINEPLKVANIGLDSVFFTNDSIRVFSTIDGIFYDILDTLSENNKLQRDSFNALINEVKTIDDSLVLKSIDEAIESMQIAKEVYLKDLEIILKLEKQINEKSNRKK